MGFLQICAGVILLQLSKSAKDVPDTAVLNGDLDQIRTVGEQVQPESEPQADALRGTAALLRRISVVRQKREKDEARTVWENKWKDEMEPIEEGEKVEWDGLRRRKTIIHERGSLMTIKAVHPPLGLTKFSDPEDEPEQRISRRGTSDSNRFGAPRRRDTGGSLIVFNTPASPRPEFSTSDSNSGKTIPGERLEMQNVYGTATGLRPESQSRSESRGKPIVWATDVNDRPNLVQSGSSDSPEMRPFAKRHFSFQKIFHKPRNIPQKQDPTLLTTNTEEERLGLTKGDSSVASSDTDENRNIHAVKTSSRSTEQLPLPRIRPNEQRTNSSPEVRTPGMGRPLPDLPPEDDDDDNDDDLEKDIRGFEGYSLVNNDNSKKSGGKFM